jgi:dienelactone hydrolase
MESRRRHRVGLRGSRRARRGIRILVIPTLAGAVALLAGGCSSASQLDVRIDVDHRVALLDAPVAISVSGLDPGQRVTLNASAASCAGDTWRSTATFTADSTGRVDLASDAPDAGSYVGEHAMGLLWSMLPTVSPPQDEIMCVPATGLSVHVTAEVQGQTRASVTLTRLATAADVHEQALRPATTGFYGEYFAPPSGGSLRPSVLIFGGSEGGLATATEGGLLASHGFPTLALAYFGEPGLPQTLQNIPLEYFVTALRWLAKQPGVDAHHVVVDGISRGSEAALLLGADFPQLVHAVIALVPNDVALCGIVPVASGRSPCAGPAWTLGGVPIPYTTEFGTPYPKDQPDAVIQVEHIDGPVLLNCGSADLVWPSCAFASAMQQRLDVKSFLFPHELFTYPDAGHGIGDSVPFDPTVVALDGGTAAADELAREDFWPRQLAFLAALQ